MSVSGIFSSNFSNYNNQTIQNNMQQFQQDFQQLGQDLQSGSLSAAQQEFATLEQLNPQANSTSAQGSNPIAQEFNQLSQDLQSGNLSAAQQDYTNIQQTFQNQAGQAHHAHHRHEHACQGSSEFRQLFSELGQALQSGSLSTAQHTYGQMLQDFPQVDPNSAQAFTQSGSNNLSVSA